MARDLDLDDAVDPHPLAAQQLKELRDDLDLAQEQRDKLTKLHAERTVERDALAALLRECREDWIRLAYGASHEDVAAYRDFATRIDAALAKDKP